MHPPDGCDVELASIERRELTPVLEFAFTDKGRLSTLLSAAGGVLLFLLLNIEIADFFSTGPTLTFGFLSGRATCKSPIPHPS